MSLNSYASSKQSDLSEPRNQSWFHKGASFFLPCQSIYECDLDRSARVCIPQFACCR